MQWPIAGDANDNDDDDDERIYSIVTWSPKTVTRHITVIEESRSWLIIIIIIIIIVNERINVAFSPKTAKTRNIGLHKKTTCSVDRERNKSSAISTRTQTSTSSNVVWKWTVTTMMWQTTVNCSTRGQRRPGKRDARSCRDDESLEQPPPLISTLHAVVRFIWVANTHCTEQWSRQHLVQ